MTLEAVRTSERASFWWESEIAVIILGVANGKIRDSPRRRDPS